MGCGLADEKTVLWRDLRGNRVRPYTVPSLLEPHRAHDVNGKRAVHPSGERSGIIERQVVTARKHGQPRPRSRRALEHEIRERSARMTGHDQVLLAQRDRFERTCLEVHASLQPRPRAGERLVQAAARWRQRRIHRQRLRRRVVENQEDLREQAMAGGEIDDAAPAKHAPDATRHLPRFVELLTGQAAGMTHRASEAIE